LAEITRLLSLYINFNSPVKGSWGQITSWKKGKVLPYLLPSVGPGADPGIQAVSWQVTLSHLPAVGCHHFLPDLRLPSQSKSVTAHCPLPSYTAWWQRHMRVNNLPKVVT